MFRNSGLYEHLKAATKETSDLLHGIKSDQVWPNDNIHTIIVSERSFDSCVRYLI